MSAGNSGTTGETGGPAGKQVKEGVHTLKKLLTKDLKVGDGMVLDIKVKNNDPVKPNDMITVQYTGRLPDGTVFDSNVPGKDKHKDPFTFVVGRGFVVPGFDQGVVGMRVGGEREIDIPASMGYGAAGQGPIPPNSDLKFTVKLLDDVRPGEEGIFDFKDQTVGSGREVKQGDTVQIEYTGRLVDGTVFDSNVGKDPFEFTIGSIPAQVISGMEAGIKGMKKGGVRILRLPPGIAYGTANVPGIPANSTLVFTIKLLNVM